jgi:hypothetical protein
MTSNLKTILSAVGVAALLASPAMAKPERHHQAAPVDAHALASPYAPAVTPYAPDLKLPAHLNGSLNPDFQLGADK